MEKRLAGAGAPFEVCWDNLGVPHVYAESVADAYRGMGYVEGHERLWQIHLSTLFATAEAASVMGRRFANQDALLKTFRVPADPAELPPSSGDWIVDAYLEGLNACVDALSEAPPEFVHASTEPRHFTRADVASRYRFTNWFQHKSWTEKMLVGRLMASHGADWFRHHLLRFSEDDERQVELLKEPLSHLDMKAAELLYPDFRMAASNNWAVTGKRSQSGKGLLAMDPHQAFSIPNTFFYVHLHAPDWDVFGASFPGVPYFMMGYTRQIAWGLTTGNVDNYDVYLEQLDDSGEAYRTPDGWAPLEQRRVTVAIAEDEPLNLDIAATRHGPLLESLTDALGLTTDRAARDIQTAVRWSIGDISTSAGTLAELPLAASAAAFGDTLFENDVCPLVNNIICVDNQDHLRRFIAATLPVREGVTGVVPLAGWESAHDFRTTTQAELTVEIDPPSGTAITANNDTMGESTPFPIHNFPAHHARASRIGELLAASETFAPADFEAMQLDLYDIRARETVPDILWALEGSEDDDLVLARELLSNWDLRADPSSAAACIYYPFLDRAWHRTFMLEVLGDDTLKVIPTGAPGFNRFTLDAFRAADSPWRGYEPAMRDAIRAVMRSVVADVRAELGEPGSWTWGRLHQVRFWHSLRRHDRWRHMQVGPDSFGGSATTLAMAAHRGNGPGKEPGVEEVPCRAAHGPAYRLVVDLADTDHCRFVIAGGNSGRVDSPHSIDHYQAWRDGEFHTVSLRREELQIEAVWRFSADGAVE